LSLLKRWGKERFLTMDRKPVKLKAGTATRRKGGGRKPVYGPEVIASLRTICNVSPKIGIIYTKIRNLMSCILHLK
jgi:hypothetical protein